MNYSNLAKLCKEEADSALGEMTGSNNDSDIILRLAGILLAVSAVLDNNKPIITCRDFMIDSSDDKGIPV